MKTIVIGLGNPVLGDDGVGWRVVEYIQHKRGLSELSSKVDFVCLSVGGLRLMENMIGYHRAILIDAINMGRHPVGDVYCLSPTELPDYKTGHTASAHDTSLSTALSLGREMGIPLPEEIVVIGIESPNVYEFSEELTEQVAEAIPRAAMILKGLIRDGISTQ